MMPLYSSGWIVGNSSVSLASENGFFVTFGEVVSGFPCLFEDVDFIRHSRRGVEADRIWRGHTWSV
jgi:hypothetical protein